MHRDFHSDGCVKIVVLLFDGLGVFRRILRDQGVAVLLVCVNVWREFVTPLFRASRDPASWPLPSAAVQKVGRAFLQKVIRSRACLLVARPFPSLNLQDVPWLLSPGSFYSATLSPLSPANRDLVVACSRPIGRQISEYRSRKEIGACWSFLHRKSREVSVAPADKNLSAQILSTTNNTTTGSALL